MGRTVIIGTLIAFAIFNLLLGLGFYLFLKKRKENPVFDSCERVKSP